MSDPNTLRILSIDGGGVRGLIPNTFMELFVQQWGINPNEIWKYFDVITGELKIEGSSGEENSGSEGNEDENEKENSNSNTPKSPKSPKSPKKSKKSPKN